jgi:hypothetical protein
MIQIQCSQCSNTVSIKPSHYGRVFTCSKPCSAARKRAVHLLKRPRVEQPDGFGLIPLSDGSLAKVSLEDYEYLASIPWSKNSQGYAVSSFNRIMHQDVMRRLLGVVDIVQVDHINRDRLDNRRQNLRLATRLTNAHNRTLTGAHIGIHRHACGKWEADIRLDSRRYYIGLFDDELHAAWMRDQWAIELHGEFASLNFEYV